MSTTSESHLGIEFTETMRGFFSTQEKNDYRAAYDLGRRNNSPLEFTVTIATDDLDHFINDAGHGGRISGTVTAPALSDRPLKVEEGRFHLLVKDPDQVATRKMLYDLKMTDRNGRVYSLEGFKILHDRQGPRVWSDTTTLYITVHDGEKGVRAVVGKGIVNIHLKDFQRQLASTKVTGARNKREELKGLACFGKFFAGSLSEIYGGIFAPSTVFDPDAPPRERRPLRCGEPEIHFFETTDGVSLKLTRFRGGSKGPVILSPGFGTSALAYTIDTTETNLPEYLFEHGYDVWVFDYRASPDLASAATQFTLDDIALRDYPAAVEFVRRTAGVETVQVMAHCVGSLTLLMSLASGLAGVRSAICSALTLHPRAPALNKIKAGLYLPSLLTAMGVDTLTTDFDSTSSGLSKLADTLLRLYPTRERCNSPVCRRILFLYGEVYDHDQLNDATHDALHEMFGVANMTTFTHLAKMLHAGHAVSADGQESYLPMIDRIKIPIAFLHGENNRLFLPDGSEATFKLLSEKNGPDLFVRHVVPNYAHMDCFLGKSASRDIYPIVCAELDKHNSGQGAT